MPHFRSYRLGALLESELSSCVCLLVSVGLLVGIKVLMCQVTQMQPLGSVVLHWVRLGILQFVAGPPGTTTAVQISIGDPDLFTSMTLHILCYADYIYIYMYICKYHMAIWGS